MDVCRVIFHPDDPSFSPAFPTDNGGGTDPPAGAGTAPASQAPTETAAPKAPHQRPSGAAIEFQTAPNQQKVKARTKKFPPITSAASSGANDDDSDYVESCKNFPAISDNSPELKTIIE